MELTVPVDRGEVWAQDGGGGGTPLVLLHPGWGDSGIWDPLLEQLPRGYRVIRYDVRGYGRSPAPTAPFSQLGDLTGVLDRLAVSRAVIVGHSGGGGTAIGFALAHPGRVLALILLAPGLQDYPWPEDDPYLHEFAALAGAGDRAGITSLGLRTWAATDPGGAAEAQIRSATRAFFAAGDFERPDPPAYGRLEELRVPTAVVLGGLDYPMVAACAAAIAARIPGCRRFTVPGADHMLPLRVPGLLVELIGQCTP